MFSVGSRASVLSVLIVCLLVEVSRAGSNWNQEARDYIVQIHNDRRRAEGGCHVNKLVYDTELENQARQWAERCVFKHELKEGRGENLAWNSNQKDEKDLIKDASDSWFNEKKTYSYGQYSCSNSMSCHYTQMVWGLTKKIGCYSTRCANLVGGVANSWYFVCFYTPKGNWNGEKPYEKSCSSKCMEGQTEDNGLCAGEAKEGKKQGPEADAICDDEVGNCPLWAKTGQCEANPEYMRLHCEKSCHICQSNGSCDDLHGSCSQWASTGQCQSNPAYMKQNCKKSCGEC